MAKEEVKKAVKKAAPKDDGKLRGYNVKAKEMQVMNKAVIEKTARGGFMAKGQSDDGANICAILSAVNAEKFVKAGVAKKKGW